MYAYDKHHGSEGFEPQEEVRKDGRTGPGDVKTWLEYTWF